MCLVALSHCSTYVLSFQVGGRTGPCAEVLNKSGSLPYSQVYVLPFRARQASGTVSRSVCQPAERLPPRPMLKPCEKRTPRPGHVAYDSKYAGPMVMVVG